MWSIFIYCLQKNIDRVYLSDRVISFIGGENVVIVCMIMSSVMYIGVDIIPIGVFVPQALL